MPITSALCPNIVCIVALGMDAVPLRRDTTRHLAQLAEEGQTFERLPARWQMARLAAFGYQTALIGGAGPQDMDAQGLGDEAARFIASQPDDQPFVMSLALPCSRENIDLRNFDRAVGQVLVALQDWGHEHSTVVLLGPVRRHHDRDDESSDELIDPSATAVLAYSSQRYRWH